MTKIVKEYIERKIREAAEPKRAALQKALNDAMAATPCHDSVMKAVYASDEYKALEAFIGKYAKAHNASVMCTNYNSKHLMDERFRLEFKDVMKVNRECNEFSGKIDSTIQDAWVAMELSKSKEDVDKLIAKAVASLK